MQYDGACGGGRVIVKRRCCVSKDGGGDAAISRAARRGRAAARPRPSVHLFNFQPEHDMSTAYTRGLASACRAASASTAHSTARARIEFGRNGARSLNTNGLATCIFAGAPSPSLCRTRGARAHPTRSQGRCLCNLQSAIGRSTVRGLPSARRRAC